jgi:hypothetical protein
MANKDNPIGGKAIDSLVASEYNAQSNKYYIPASDSTDLWVNDFVKFTGTSSDTGIPIVTKANPGDEIIGVLNSVKSVLEKDDYIYRKGNEERILYVIDAPYIEIEIQVNGTITSSDIGKYADIVIGAGNEATGVSTTQLDLSTLNTDHGQLRILGILEKEGNEWGALTHVRCLIAEHEHKGTVALNDELQIYSIGKEGLASNSGLNVNDKLDTIGNARDAISAFRGVGWTPAADEAQVIYGRDAGEYTSGFRFTTTNHQYINLYYPNVRIYSAGNQITTGDNINVKEIIPPLIDGIGIEKTGSGTASVIAKEIKCQGSGSHQSILVSGGRLDSNVDALTDSGGLPFFTRSLQVDSGSGYHRGNTASKDIFVDTGAYANVILGELTTDIYLEANATADIFIVGTFGGKITAKAGATLNLICGKQLNSTGADSIDGTATVNKIILANGTSVLGSHLSLPTTNISCIDLTALGLSILSAGQVQSTATDTVADSFTMTIAANAGAITFLNSATAKTVTFPNGVFPISAQGKIYNSGTAEWTIVAEGGSFILSNEPITPLQPFEEVFWTKVSSTQYYIYRKRQARRVFTGPANYNPSVLTDDTMIFVNDTSVPRSVIISTEDVQSGASNRLRPFHIKDVTGGAGANNITVSLESAGSIDGAANFVINSNYGCVSIWLDGVAGWII